MTNKLALPVIDLALCCYCGECAAVCQEHALAMDNETDTPVFAEPEACTYCTACEEVCPQNAIQCPLTISWDTEE